MIIQDQVKHSILKASQLREENEEIRYIIPHLYTAAKLIHEHAGEYRFDHQFIDRLAGHFREVYDSELQTSKLEQVHLFMLEQIESILSCRCEWDKSIHRVYPTGESALSVANASQQCQFCVYIPQQTYFFTNASVSEARAENNQPTIIREIVSLQAIPSFLHKSEDCSFSYQRVQRLYKDHKLDQAYLESEQCRKKMCLTDPNLAMPPMMRDLLGAIQSEYQMMTYYYQFFQEPGYVFDKEQNDVRMFYKVNEQKKEVSVRVQAEVDISIENFLCIVSEIDFYEQYVPFSYDTKELKSLARNKKIGLTKVYLPLLSDRVAYFYAAAYDRLATHNSIFFYSKTITSDAEFQKKVDLVIESDSELVELDYKFYIMEYTPVTMNRGRIRLATNVNMKLGFLPMFIINKTCRIFAFDYFQNIVKVNEKFKGSQWEQRMLAKPEIYAFFRERINQYLEESQLKQQ